MAESEVQMVQKWDKRSAFPLTVPSNLSFGNIEGKHISVLKNEAEVEKFSNR